MEANNEYDVFISYRRDSGKEYARMLKPELEKRGFKIFLDFDELNDGVFDQRIKDAINNSPVFLLILSKGALDRCLNEGDWVREEILYAKKCHCHIIPVEFDKSFRSVPEQTPKDISAIIGSHSWAQIDTESLLQESVDKMVVNQIKPYVHPKKDRTQTKKQTTPTIKKNTEYLRKENEKEILYAHYSQLNTLLGRNSLWFFWSGIAYIAIISGVVLILFNTDDFWWFWPTILSFAIYSVVGLINYIYHKIKMRQLQLTVALKEEFEKRCRLEYKNYKDFKRRKRLNLLSEEDYFFYKKAIEEYEKRNRHFSFYDYTLLISFIVIILIWIL